MLYKTLGVVLRYFSFGEADKIVTFYSSRFGKIKAVVKGVRKTKSRFGSSMELFTNNNLLLHHKENKELYLVTQTSIVDSFKELRDDLNKFYKTSYIVEVVDSMVKETEKNQILFDFIIQTLSTLKHLNTDSELEKILRLFEIKILSILGYKLKLDRCSLCNKELTNSKCFISPIRAGILCEICSGKFYKKISLPVSIDSINIMDLMQNTEIKDIEKLKITNQNQIELKKILPNFIKFYAEKEFNTLKFL